MLLLANDPDKALNIQDLIDEDIFTFRGGSSAMRLGKQTLYLPKEPCPPINQTLEITDAVTDQDPTLTRFQNGSIRIDRAEAEVKPAKLTLRKIAARLGAGPETTHGQVKTTHQLGSHIIEALAT